MKNTEIERKWLVGGFPSLEAESEEWMEQGYLAFEPAVVRIRKTVTEGGTACFLTIKGKGTLSRTEVELPLEAEQYAALLPLVAAPTAEKRLRRYRLEGGKTLECSLVDEGQPGAFYYAEVEFENEKEARAFVPPPFLKDEVTEQPGYSMAAYCRAKLKDRQDDG